LSNNFIVVHCLFFEEVEAETIPSSKKNFVVVHRCNKRGTSFIELHRGTNPKPPLHHF
jgi:hypothetical protein